MNYRVDQQRAKASAFGRGSKSRLRSGAIYRQPAAGFDGSIWHIDGQSLSRRLRLKRKYNQTAYSMISGGKRWPLKPGEFLHFVMFDV